MSQSDSSNISFPENIKKLLGYVPGKTIDEVKEFYKPGKISKLASNENRLGCSSRVEGAVLKALKEIQNYPDPVAKRLRREIADRNHASPVNIMLAAGSESIISIICRTLFKNHEHAITADATFAGFFVQAGVMGIDVKKIPITESYAFDIERILSAVDENTKAVYIANPNNPTGTYINKTGYNRLISELPDSVLLITDEAYFEYAKDVEDYPHATENLRSNVIVLRTFSKGYGLAGFRIGYAIAHADIIEMLMKAKLTFEPTACAQAAALAAYNDPDFLKNSVEMVQKGRENLYRFFDKHQITYVESISNSVLICLENESEASEFTQSMLEEGVILRQVSAFGLPKCIRITIGDEDDMQHFRKSFEKVMQESLPSAP